ncbi:KTSC domain-containing protein [Maritimibacter alkaliphilus HTCC2654]|nr:KTSC domain-containing protein [Maritimibacter alkaliphilus]TYP82979.1 KTSC domain-containing protein [Maritimibacter alkaliphilus HTCC2654]
MLKYAVGLAMMAVALPCVAETVNVKYWGAADLDEYACTDTQSSFVHRICFNGDEAHVVVLLNSTYYAYCNVDAATVRNWLNSSSKGRFYNANIKNSGSGGRFSCN